MTTQTKNNKSWIAGVFTAIAASLCCITPVLAFLGGASGLAASFSWIEPYRPYLIAFTLAVFAFAWYQKLKFKKMVDCDCEDEKKSFLQSKLFLFMITMVAGLLITFPYYASIFYPKPTETNVVVVNKSSVQAVAFSIEGMTCESCTQHVNSKIAKIYGVIEFQTSYEKANSIVKFDDSKTTADSITAAINSTGYKVVSQKNINIK